MAASSDSSFMGLSYVQEVTVGVTPTAALNEFIFSSETLKQNPTLTKSTSVRRDRRVQDRVLTDVQPGGQINYNFAYKRWQDFIAAYAGSTWSSDLALTGSIGITGPNLVTSDTAAAGPVFAPIKVGQWIRLSSFTNPANGPALTGTFVKVIAKGVVGTVTTLTTSGATLVTEAPAAGRKLQGSLLQDGNTKTSFSIEKFFTDTGLFDSGTGFRVGQFNLTMTAKQPITGSFTFLGAFMAAVQTATIGTGPLVADLLNQEMNGSRHFLQLFLNGVPSTADVRSLVMNGNDNLVGKGKLGTLGNFDVRIGDDDVTGTMEMYFEDRVTLNQARIFGNIGIASRIQDDAGNAYVLDVPNVVLSGGDPQDPGLNNDVVNTYDWAAKIDPLSGVTFNFCRFDHL